MSAEAFVAAARALKGVRHRHRGRKPWAVDCVGLVVLAGEAAGLVFEGIPTRYGREPWDNTLRKELRRLFGEPVTPPRAGDIALIRWGRGEPTHLAVVGERDDGLTLIHADNLHGVIETPLRGRYEDFVVEAYRPWPA